MSEPAMTRVVDGVTIEVRRADITALPLDAVVDAADAALARGDRVDGAIRRAAGPASGGACRASAAFQAEMLGAGRAGRAR